MTRALIAFIACITASLSGATQVSPEKATEMLEQQSLHFKKRIVAVAENVFVAVGYHGANTAMIAGDDGVIFIDTLLGPTSATEALAAFREHSDQPVKAIIYTHSHNDHIGGASVFAEGKDIPIYATDTFGSAEGVNTDLAPIKAKRNIRQFGRTLAPNEIINRGVAPAGTHDADRGKGHIPPTHSISEDGTKVTIAGVELEFYFAPGETDDAMFIWLPKERVLFAGDNFYQAFPNLYAIRGTAYRNVLDWSESVAKMAQFEPDCVVPGHTSPIIGKEAATMALNNYSEAIRSIYDQTISGINAGKDPNQLANEVQLPNHLKNQPYLTEFYGSIPHAVRAIYTGLLGWFDGNPAHLNPLHPTEEAQKLAKLAGGIPALNQQMEKAIEEKDFQWALQLADALSRLPDTDQAKVKTAKIRALRGLAAREYNAPNRNYYLSVANELESGEASELQKAFEY